MGKIAKIFCFAVAASLVLTGCKAEKVTPGSRVVTGVQVTFQEEDAQLFRHYTQEQKMEYVLLYLRLLKKDGIAEPQPDTARREYCITVTHADGSCAVYRQRAHRYFSVDGRPWENIAPAQAAELYRILRYVPSDGL